MVKLFYFPPAFRHATIAIILTTPRRYPYQHAPFISTLRGLSSHAGRTYTDALTLLDKLQSNRSVVSSISNSARDANQDAIPEMLDWTRKAGYAVEDFPRHGLRCIHVAGTKGKGSVCAFVENILLQYRGQDIDDGLMNGGKKRLGKIGAYTSPHLITVRERIRIDGSPISETLFTRYFFEVWDRFCDAASDSDPMSLDTKPGYFRYLTILSLHAFAREGVETAIIECGIGGEYDSTNILPPEAITVCAIARLGIDHVGMLGQSIEEIAWHKAGIMKAGVPAFTIEQDPVAQAVLEKRAAEKSVKLEVARRFDSIELRKTGMGFAMAGDFQRTNASLAALVTASHLRTLGVTDGVPESQATPIHPQELSEQFRHGLETAKLLGRCEVRKDGNIDWLIDGAHTIDSMEAVAQWFISKVGEAHQEGKPPTSTMLIFNQQDREAEKLIHSLITGAAKAMHEFQLNSSYDIGGRSWARYASRVFTYAAFCTNTPFKDELDPKVELQPQERMAAFYGRLDGNPLHMCYGSVEEAVELARKVSEGDERVLVLVTGSLYLVGGLLRVLEKEAPRLG